MTFFLVRIFHEKSISIQVRCSAHSHARKQALTDTRRTHAHHRPKAHRPRDLYELRDAVRPNSSKNYALFRVCEHFVFSSFALRRELSLCERTMCRWMLLLPKRKPLTSAKLIRRICEIYTTNNVRLVWHLHERKLHQSFFTFRRNAVGQSSV